MASERELRLFVPIALLEAIDSLRRTRNRLLNELNREPNCDEILQETGLDTNTVTFLLHVLQRFPFQPTPPEAPSETSEPINETDEEYIPRFLAEIEAGGEKARRAFGEAIRKVFVMLTPCEEQILRMRFGIGFDKALSLEEVGKQFGLTADSILEIEAKILRKLRQTSRPRNLEGFQEK